MKRSRSIWIFLVLLIAVLAILFSRFYDFSHTKKKETEDDWILQMEEALKEQKQDRIEQEKAEQGEIEQEGQEQGKTESEQREKSAEETLEYNIDVQKKENKAAIGKGSSDLQKADDIGSQQMENSSNLQKADDTGSQQMDSNAVSQRVDHENSQKSKDVQKKPQPESSTGNTQFDFETAINNIDSQMNSLEQEIQDEIDSHINKTLGRVE